jgi:hypothetical protein
MPSPVDHRTSAELVLSPPEPPNVVPIAVVDAEPRIRMTPRGEAVLAADRLRRLVEALPREDREELAPILADLSYTTAKAAVVDDGTLRIDRWTSWMVTRVGRAWQDLSPAQRERLAPRLLAIAEGVNGG